MSDPAFDLVIRNGTIADGSGGVLYEGDIGIDGREIVEVGSGLGKGNEEIDARGLLVTPGFVDIHTHYDGQATWDERLEPSTSHGVTTAVFGNCGVGFAPCRSDQREALIRLMEGVEDIPGSALAEGLQWDWQTFPEYLDKLDSMPREIDVAAYVPHGALRAFVMGERGIDREEANDDDMAAMAAEIRAALAAGAVGLATSRTVAHKTADGDPTPMFGAQAKELAGLGAALGNTGVFQLVSDFFDEDEEFGILEAVVEAGAATASFSIAQTDNTPDKWRSLLRRAELANARGLRIRAQAIGRPTGVLMALEASIHPFIFRPSYREIADLPLPERLVRMRDPEVRKQILSEEDQDAHQFVATYYRGSTDKLFPWGAEPDYSPGPEDSFGARARREGRNPEELIYDFLIAGDGGNLIYLPIYNFSEGNLDVARQMVQHPLTVPGLGDGGAHVGVICDASATTHLLQHWARDEGAISIGEAVSLLSWKGAAEVGLRDRGVIAPGWKADINVIDLDKLGLGRPEIVWDLPAGGRRFLQPGRGYVATIVSGEISRRDGEAQQALSGRLARVRGEPLAA